MTTECIFNQDGKLINIGPWDYQFEQADEASEPVAQNPLPEDAYSEEREVFIDDDGGRHLAKDPLLAVEKWISKHFSPVRLLQMKVWLDELPAEDTPKLRSAYAWTGAIIESAAAQGETNFPPPPYSFEELVAEAMSLIQPA
jgi:hypothetical protein